MALTASLVVAPRLKGLENNAPDYDADLSVEKQRKSASWACVEKLITSFGFRD